MVSASYVPWGTLPEQILVRPFRNKESALGPYLRYFNGLRSEQPKCAGGSGAPILAAVEEAARLPEISPDKLRTKFQCLPEKAPGADGWNNRILKQLPQEALQPLVDEGDERWPRATETTNAMPSATGSLSRMRLYWHCS